MTNALDILWATLEAVEPVLTPDAWRRIPTESRSALTASKLFVPGPPAHRIRCPACATPHMAPIIARPGPAATTRLFVKCPREARVPITEAHLQTWRGNARSVAESIAASLSLSGGVRAIRSDRVIDCGQLQSHGQRAGVFLARALCRRDGHKFAQAIPRSALPSVVFVPSEIPPDDIWLEPRPLVFALSGSCELSDDALIVNRRVVEQSLARRVDGWRGPRYLFRRAGDYWDVSFNGSGVTHIDHSVGMTYLALLLAVPYRDVAALDLLIARAGVHPDTIWGGAGEIADEEFLRQIRVRYSDLQTRRDDATKHHDLGTLHRVQQEMDQLAAELGRRMDRRGKPRKETDAETVRKAVSNAVSRAIDGFKGHLPELMRHLRASVNSGTVFRYEPETEIDWSL